MASCAEPYRDPRQQGHFPAWRHGLFTIAKPGFEPVQLPATGLAFNHRLDAGSSLPGGMSVVTLAACWMYVGAVTEGMRKISYAGYRVPPEVIHQAIWLYLRFTLSFRDVEDLLAERGIEVSYETVRRWVNHFGPMIAAHLRKRRPKPHAT